MKEGVYRIRIGNPERGYIVLIHGLGEHIGRYEKFIEKLVKNGFCVIGFDWPGHGKSRGKRGHTSIEEALEIINEIISEIGEKPFLFGHSLGGLTVIRYAQS
ncbi:lysophospholipase [Pyrococcus sp. NA2]|nr:lysophospholipase [Pyrococcus sp. NA2]